MIKRKYDPGSVFYCPTCIGSQMWEPVASGKLCLKLPASGLVYR